MKATVLGDFEATTDEEISFPVGTIVEVITQGDDGWWEVECDGKKGLFPYTYLKVEEEEGKSEDQSNGDDSETGEEEEEKPVIETEVKEVEEPKNDEEKERLKQEQHRRNVVEEIITTERDYIADLEIVVKVFIQPLQEKGIISPMDLQSLFSNLLVIISVNKEVQKSFESRSDCEGPLLVGDIFLKMADFFKMYTMYCANQPKALATLDRLTKVPAFSDFLQEALLNPETRALSLFSFLIKPIQRICKYPLLLKDLLKHTEKDHPDYDNLDNALNKINEVVEYVNERKRLAENLQKILEIQNQIHSDHELSLVEPSRRFVREGMIQVFEPQKNRRLQRRMFVFNDLIVLTKQKKTIMGKDNKDNFKAKFHLNEVKLIEMADSEDGLIKDACEVMPKNNQGKSLILVFTSTNEKREWLKEVKMLVKEFQKKEAQAAKEAKLKAAEEAALAATLGDQSGNSVGATNSPTNNNTDVINIAGVPNASKLSLTKSSSRTIKGPLVKSNSTSTMITSPPQSGPSPNTSPSPLRSSRASIFGKKPKEKKEKEEKEKKEDKKEKKEDKKDKSKRASSSSIDSHNNNSNAAAPNKLKNSQFSKELAKTLKANAPPPKKF